MSDFTPVNLSADETTNEFAKASALRTAIYEAAQRNTDDQFKYDSAIRGYNAQMATGALTPPAVPVAPFKWVVEPALDQPNGYAAAVQSTTERLTSAIPISTFNAAVPIVYPPGHADIGHQIGDSAFYTAMPDDTIPAGEDVMWSDGRIYSKRSNPWSRSGQYVLKGA